MYNGDGSQIGTVLVIFRLLVYIHVAIPVLTFRYDMAIV